ncbi:hypothetical protein EON62_06070, partial [archaeon]
MPDIPAALVPLGEWAYFTRFSRMLKFGLPRDAVMHKMVSENVNPALLDADPTQPVLATQLSPPKVKKSNKPQIVRKKLHWIPIKVCAPRVNDCRVCARALLLLPRLHLRDCGVVHVCAGCPLSHARLQGK